MITKKIGNLLAVERGILVHGCNCLGMMGSGVARLIRDKWTGVYLAYRDEYCATGLKLGDVQFIGSALQSRAARANRHLSKEILELPKDLIVANAMTQYDCGHHPDVVYADYDAIFAAFARIRLVARDTGLPVHFPLIGCGLANGKWDRVSEMIEAALGDDIEAILWELPA